MNVFKCLNLLLSLLYFYKHTLFGDTDDFVPEKNLIKTKDKDGTGVLESIRQENGFRRGRSLGEVERTGDRSIRASDTRDGDCCKRLRN